MERSSPLSVRLKIQIQNLCQKYKCSGCTISILNFILPTYFSTFYGSSPELWHFPQSLWLSEPNTEISYKLSENHIKMSKIGEFQDSRQIPATPNPTVLIYLRPFQSNILFENSQNQIESVWNISMIFARKKILRFSVPYFLDHFWEDEVSTQSDGFTRWRANIHFPAGWKSIQCQVLQRLKQLAKDVGGLARTSQSLPQHTWKKTYRIAGIKSWRKK